MPLLLQLRFNQDGEGPDRPHNVQLRVFSAFGLYCPERMAKAVVTDAPAWLDTSLADDHCACTCKQKLRTKPSRSNHQTMHDPSCLPDTKTNSNAVAGVCRLWAVLPRAHGQGRRDQRPRLVRHTLVGGRPRRRGPDGSRVLEARAPAKTAPGHVLGLRPGGLLIDGVAGRWPVLEAHWQGLLEVGLRVAALRAGTQAGAPFHSPDAAEPEAPTPPVPSSPTQSPEKDQNPLARSLLPSHLTRRIAYSILDENTRSKVGGVIAERHLNGARLSMQHLPRRFHPALWGPKPHIADLPAPRCPPAPRWCWSLTGQRCRRRWRRCWGQRT